MDQQLFLKVVESYEATPSSGTTPEQRVALRKALGFDSPRELAKVLGLQPGQVEVWEAGGRHDGLTGKRYGRYISAATAATEGSEDNE